MVSFTRYSLFRPYVDVRLDNSPLSGTAAIVRDPALATSTRRQRFAISRIWIRLSSPIISIAGHGVTDRWLPGPQQGGQNNGIRDCTQHIG